MKKCKKCQCEKEPTEYYNQKNYRDGLDPMCKKCRDKTSLEYKEKNIDRLKQYWKDHHKKVYDKEKRHQYYIDNIERFKEYYKKRKQLKNENRQ